MDKFNGALATNDATNEIIWNNVSESKSQAFTASMRQNKTERRENEREHER